MNGRTYVVIRTELSFSGITPTRIGPNKALRLYAHSGKGWKSAKVSGNNTFVACVGDFEHKLDFNLTTATT